MSRSFVFYAENKSFDVVEINDNWFEVVERRKNFISRITIDRKNILALCYCMEQASEEEKKCRSWKNQSQLYSYFYKYFNSMGSYIRVVAINDKGKVAIIIPEISKGAGWCDFAKKIRMFVEVGQNQKFPKHKNVKERIYMLDSTKGGLAKR